jgi:hypothetical protein
VLRNVPTVVYSQYTVTEIHVWLHSRRRWANLASSNGSLPLHLQARTQRCQSHRTFANISELEAEEANAAALAAAAVPLAVKRARTESRSCAASGIARFFAAGGGGGGAEGSGGEVVVILKWRMICSDFLFCFICFALNNIICMHRVRATTAIKLFAALIAHLNSVFWGQGNARELLEQAQQRVLGAR